MNTLFSRDDDQSGRQREQASGPLADRMRPRSLDEVIGQEQLLGIEGPLRAFFESGSFPSMIFWGPPGVGKTTLALLVADLADYRFIRLSAIEAGVKDVRKVIAGAEFSRQQGHSTLLFIDEIHRFNKSQQDALLHAVEKGIITLIGATTENPSFEVNAALLSRCQVYRLQHLTDEQLRLVVRQAIDRDEQLRQANVEIEDWDALLRIAGGDARTALNALEMAISLAKPTELGKRRINAGVLERALQRKTAQYDKKGESHYDTVSAFIKSMRGSDPDAALFWLAKMIEAGEDPKFIARRLVIFASEDVGNADPSALGLAVNVFNAVNLIGMPEAQLNLAQGVTYLASAPKSNASYLAVKQALQTVAELQTTVPLHLRNAPTALMKNEDYGARYQYPHDFPDHFVTEHYFPEGLQPISFYRPGELGSEAAIAERLRGFWPDRYKKPNDD